MKRYQAYQVPSGRTPLASLAASRRGGRLWSGCESGRSRRPNGVEGGERGSGFFAEDRGPESYGSCAGFAVSVRDRVDRAEEQAAALRKPDEVKRGEDHGSEGTGGGSDDPQLITPDGEETGRGDQEDGARRAAIDRV